MTCRIIGLFVTLSLTLLAAPHTQAQPAGKVYRIGWLSPTTSWAGASELEALRAGLRELGYLEGRNMTIESRWADGEPAALPALARSLVELNVDVICPSGTQASLAAKQATTMIPIVFAAATFPDETGLVTSYARPGQTSQASPSSDRSISSGWSCCARCRRSSPVWRSSIMTTILPVSAH
jgi:putative tryptophan/tyrosine transport system substrate-binding protein